MQHVEEHERVQQFGADLPDRQIHTATVGVRGSNPAERRVGCTALRAAPDDGHNPGSTVGDTASRSAAVTDAGTQQSRSLSVAGMRGRGT